MEERGCVDPNALKRVTRPGIREREAVCRVRIYYELWANTPRAMRASVCATDDAADDRFYVTRSVPFFGECTKLHGANNQACAILMSFLYHMSREARGGSRFLQILNTYSGIPCETKCGRIERIWCYWAFNNYFIYWWWKKIEIFQ